jgi:hypothetical protein
VLADPAHASALRDAGVRRSSAFDLEVLCDRYLEIYAQVIAAAPAPVA